MPPWPGPALRHASIRDAARICFFGDDREITTADHWQRAHPAALWMYNLHYFEDLDAVPQPERGPWQRAFLERWLRDNPPTQGLGWDSYPMSLRIVSWIRWLLRGNAPVDGMIESLAVQARHLRARLEHHLLGNHLFVNAKALVFAGVFFEGAEADGWRAEGERLLVREVAEQILEDGGHFERSPMYHALILEDVLDLIALSTIAPGTTGLEPRLRAVAPPMLRWLVAMTHPDGEIALFNDATTGVAAVPAALHAYAGSLGIVAPEPGGAVVDLAASGYTRIERGAAVLLADTGPLGPDHLPAHGHADTLSFELSIAGRRVIVDTGVSEYGSSPERLRQRGTAAHNTVVVDDVDSSEVWGGFRVARRARIHDRRVEIGDGQVTVSGSHDGYRRLSGRVIHHRRWQIEDGAISIHDELRGGGRHSIALHLHCAPELRPERRGGSIWALGPRIHIETAPGLTWSVAATTYHPAMAARIPAWVLTGRTETVLPLRAHTRIVWT